MRETRKLICVASPDSGPLKTRINVCYGGCAKGWAISKQRFSHWIVDTITARYGMPFLHLGTLNKIHRLVLGMVVRSIQNICLAVGWSSQNTFASYIHPKDSFKSHITQHLWLYGLTAFQTLSLYLGLDQSATYSTKTLLRATAEHLWLSDIHPKGSFKSHNLPSGSYVLQKDALTQSILLKAPLNKGQTNHSESAGNQNTIKRRRFHLSVLPVDMIKSFPIDYMHQSRLGVMKKMLLWWARDRSEYRMSSGDVAGDTEEINS
ncbi:hypothetical protein QQF64_023802 [Cirrhinus molitorella]|uniref:Uncharacterized protein n=1 Tax=Cirrhinus molitorella TaxID=172907 RepID=A0ABR3NJP4_9TELE